MPGVRTASKAPSCLHPTGLWSRSSNTNSTVSSTQNPFPILFYLIRDQPIPFDLLSGRVAFDHWRSITASAALIKPLVICRLPFYAPSLASRYSSVSPSRWSHQLCVCFEWHLCIAIQGFAVPRSITQADRERTEKDREQSKTSAVFSLPLSSRCFILACEVVDWCHAEHSWTAQEKWITGWTDRRAVQGRFGLFRTDHSTGQDAHWSSSHGRWEFVGHSINRFFRRELCIWIRNPLLSRFEIRTKKFR